MNVNIIFGSELGTTKYIAELIQEIFQKKSHKADLYHVTFDKLNPNINDYDLLLFGSPTYFGAKLEANMAEFTESFTGSLQDKKIALFAVGDSGYPNFCGAAKTLEEWVKDHAGEPIVKTFLFDGYPKEDAAVEKWIESLIQEATKHD